MLPGSHANNPAHVFVLHRPHLINKQANKKMPCLLGLYFAALVVSQESVGINSHYYHGFAIRTHRGMLHPQHPRVRSPTPCEHVKTLTTPCEHVKTLTS
jgi:hypothetical protein